MQCSAVDFVLYICALSRGDERVKEVLALRREKGRAHIFDPTATEPTSRSSTLAATRVECGAGNFNRLGRNGGTYRGEVLSRPIGASGKRSGGRGAGYAL